MASFLVQQCSAQHVSAHSRQQPLPIFFAYDTSLVWCEPRASTHGVGGLTQVQHGCLCLDHHLHRNSALIKAVRLYIFYHSAMLITVRHARIRRPQGRVMIGTQDLF